MSLCDYLAEESEAESRWRKAHPHKGDRFTLRGIEYRVVDQEPLTMVGPSGVRRRVTADVLERMAAKERLPL